MATARKTKEKMVGDCNRPLGLIYISNERFWEELKVADFL
jgi:hypothetical protein